MDEIIPWLRTQHEDDEQLAQAYLARREHEGTDRETWAYKLIVAQVESERHLLDEYAEALRRGDEHEDREVGYRMGLETAVAAMALRYADRPGYREEWAPYFFYASRRAPEGEEGRQS